jgi:hypothetical protein
MTIYGGGGGSGSGGGSGGVGGIRCGVRGSVANMGQTTINQKAAAIVAETVVVVAAAHVEMVTALVVEAEAVKDPTTKIKIA